MTSPFGDYQAVERNNEWWIGRIASDPWVFAGPYKTERHAFILAWALSNPDEAMNRLEGVPATDHETVKTELKELKQLLGKFLDDYGELAVRFRFFSQEEIDALRTKASA